jgi:hypothetical protein
MERPVNNWIAYDFDRGKYKIPTFGGFKRKVFTSDVKIFIYHFLNTCIRYNICCLNRWFLLQTVQT